MRPSATRGVVMRPIATHVTRGVVRCSLLLHRSHVRTHTPPCAEGLWLVHTIMDRLFVALQQLSIAVISTIVTASTIYHFQSLIWNREQSVCQATAVAVTHITIVDCQMNDYRLSVRNWSAPFRCIICRSTLKFSISCRPNNAVEVFTCFWFHVQHLICKKLVVICLYIGFTFLIPHVTWKVLDGYFFY